MGKHPDRSAIPSRSSYPSRGPSDPVCQIRRLRAELLITWLIEEYSKLCQASPASQPIGNLRALVEQRLQGKVESSEVLEALYELEKAPYLLETAVLILKLEGFWPDDPESVFLVHAELLVAILEFAPEYSIPWVVMAKEPFSA